MVVGRVTIL